MLRDVSDPWYYCWSGKIVFMASDRHIFYSVNLVCKYGGVPDLG